jgi:foldase protein PrsA
VPAGLAVAGCGGVPGNAVAEVDGTPIQKASFDHWMGVVAKSSGQASAAIPQPPDFTACVAQLRKQAPTPKKGAKPVSDDTLRSQCKQQYEALRNQTVQLLVSFRWIEGEAKEMGITVSDAEVNKTFEQQKKQSFSKEAEYQKFLKQSGQTEADIKERVRLDLLSNKIRDKIIKGKDKVTDAQIADYYNKNKAKFATPESRDLRVVLTKSKARAEQARQAIASGRSWASVAKKYSIDSATKTTGGKLPGVQKGTQDKELEDAVFAAKKGKLTGPVKTSFGYYVFDVTGIHPAKQQSLQDAKATIRQVVATQNQQNALNSFITKFRDEWRGKTDCREGYVTSECSNGPKPTPTPQAPQQAPSTPGGQPGQ